MSDSSIATSTCICDRSCAIVNSVGVLRLAATVWPGSTWREITTPSTGAVIAVFDEIVARARQRRFALLDDRAAFATCASAEATCACVGAHRLGGPLLDEHRLVALGRSR